MRPVPYPVPSARSTTHRAISCRRCWAAHRECPMCGGGRAWRRCSWTSRCAPVRYRAAAASAPSASSLRPLRVLSAPAPPAPQPRLRLSLSTTTYDTTCDLRRSSWRRRVRTARSATPPATRTRRPLSRTFVGEARHRRHQRLSLRQPSVRRRRRRPQRRSSYLAGVWCCEG